VTCVGVGGCPTLEANQQGNDLVLRWPASFTGYSLTATTNLCDAAVWSDVMPPPTVVNGTNVVTNAVSGDRKFYRLTKP
jgi:hypothetical protein